jgi:hypothetical protein
MKNSACVKCPTRHITSQTKYRLFSSGPRNIRGNTRRAIEGQIVGPRTGEALP